MKTMDNYEKWMKRGTLASPLGASWAIVTYQKLGISRTDQKSEREREREREREIKRDGGEKEKKQDRKREK